MTHALPAAPREDEPRLPPALPQSTVSEIASWLVGHTLDEVERELIHYTLAHCGGDRVLAASVLGVSLPVLKRKMTAYAVRGQALPEPAADASANEQAPANENAPAGEGANTNETVPAEETALQFPPADNDREPAPAAVASAAKPERPKRIGFRVLAGLALAALTGLLSLGLFGRKEPAANFVLPERPRIEVSIAERPLPAQPTQLRIPVPAWNGRMPPLPEPKAAAVEPETAIGIVATPIEPAVTAATAVPTRAAAVAFDSAQDTIMELAPAAPAPARQAAVTFDSAQDTIMESAAPAPAAKTGASEPARGALFAVNIEEDTRMDSAAVFEPAADSAPVTTAAIDSDASLAAPDDVPEPLARPAPAAPAKAAPVKRQVRPRAAPAQAAAPLPAATPAQPKQPVFPFINIFAPKNTPRTAAGTAAPGN